MRKLKTGRVNRVSRKYSHTQIKILLALDKKKLRKSEITKRYWKLTVEERESLLKTLIDDQLIHSELCPMPNAKKTPTFYSLTKEGKSWVKNYLESFE